MYRCKSCLPRRPSSVVVRRRRRPSSVVVHREDVVDYLVVYLVATVPRITLSDCSGKNTAVGQILPARTILGLGLGVWIEVSVRVGVKVGVGVGIKVRVRFNPHNANTVCTIWCEYIVY